MYSYYVKGRLGKNETGIINPVVAKMRPQRAGLNFDGVDTSGTESKQNRDCENLLEKAELIRRKRRYLSYERLSFVTYVFYKR